MTILLVRHGSAGDRYCWSGDDADRPLDATGTNEAICLADEIDDLLAGRPLIQVRSSRATRCLQTVGPAATAEEAESAARCDGVRFCLTRRVFLIGAARAAAKPSCLALACVYGPHCRTDTDVW